MEYKCPECLGSGVLEDNDECEICSGTGYVDYNPFPTDDELEDDDTIFPEDNQNELGDDD